MVAEFESVSMAMTDPDADLDALTHKMSRLQVGVEWVQEGWRGAGGGGGDTLHRGHTHTHNSGYS